MIFDRTETFQGAISHLAKYHLTTNRDRFFNFPQHTLLLTNIKIIRYNDQAQVAYFFAYRSQKYTQKVTSPNGQIRKFQFYFGKVFGALGLLESQLRKPNLPVYPVLLQ